MGIQRSFQEPVGGPNFYSFATDATYKINIDSDGDGDARPDVTYQWSFRDEDKRAETFLSNNGPVTSPAGENLLYKQRYTLKELRGKKERVLVKDGIAAPSHADAYSQLGDGAKATQAVRLGGDRTGAERDYRAVIARAPQPQFVIEYGELLLWPPPLSLSSSEPASYSGA